MTPSQKPHRAGSLAAALLFFAAPATWIVFQQGVGLGAYFDCAAAGRPWGVLAGALAGLACAAVAAACWARRNQGPPTRRFLMVVGAGSAAIFATAALTMTLAIVLVPACAR